MRAIQAVLEADPRYADIHAQALAIEAAKDRIPSPAFRAGRLFNFWQDRLSCCCRSSCRWSRP
ncbi:MAG TPA: hypothetical protein VGL50_05835 [Steroidobacteraceae bacterium]